jgi:hypothetical protein
VSSLAYTRYPQSSYTTSDIIPLTLTLTSENREALDLLAVSDVIDARLQKVLGFGEHAATVRPLSLKDRKSFHRTDLAARASWQPDGHVRELLPDEGHRLPRWSIQLNGSLQREAGVELSPSFELPGMALTVRLLTFDEDLRFRLMSAVVYCIPLHVPLDGLPSRRPPGQSACYGQDSAHCTKTL